MLHAKLLLKVGPGCGEVGHGRRPRSWEVVGVYAAFPLVETVADLVVGAAELQLPFVRVMDPVGLQVPIPQADIGGLDCQLQPLLGCLLCVFGVLLRWVISSTMTRISAIVPVFSANGVVQTWKTAPEGQGSSKQFSSPAKVLCRRGATLAKMAGGTMSRRERWR